MDRLATTTRRVATLAFVLATTLMLTACGPDIRNGQLVDAGGERGQGGLAFVILAFFVGVLFASLFYMDRVRNRRSGESED
jgi:Zn-dependent protease with chaperone function